MGMLVEPVKGYFAGLRARAGDLGVEIECEGRALPIGPFHFWHAKADHSLRGEAIEYVLRQPSKIAPVGDALDELHKAFKDHNTVLNMSNRTSVHVHVNVQKFMLQEVYNIVGLHYLLEDILVEYSGPERVGNLFCLRSCDAEYLPMLVARSAASGNHFTFLNDMVRYSSLNLNPLSTFGSVEFRSFRGTADKDEILAWCQVCLAVRDAAKRFNDPRELLRVYRKSSAEDFLRSIFSVEFVERTLRLYDWQQAMRKGEQYLVELAYATDKWEDLEKARKSPKRKVDPFDDDDDAQPVEARPVDWANVALGGGFVQMDAPGGLGRQPQRRLYIEDPAEEMRAADQDEEF
jgi:hypothetical protein